MTKKARHETVIADARPNVEPVRLSLEIIARMLERVAEELRNLARSLH